MEETKREQWYPFGNGGGYGGLFEPRVPRSQGLLLGTDSSMSSEGILKATVQRRQLKGSKEERGQGR